jgi:hypothetical protein
MQRYQRKRHLVMWVVIGGIVAGMMVWGLMGRKAVPVVEEVPVEMGVEQAEEEEFVEK